MSGDDELLPEGVPSFDDPAYAELRAALADVGAGEPMPADVVARLDSVLADLSGSAGVEPAEEAPIPLRRRSRSGPRLLAAAAAVVVLAGGGVGLAKVLSQHGGSVAADNPAATSTETAGGTAPPTLRAPLAPSPLHVLKSAPVLPQLSSAHFGLDVSRLMLRGQVQSFGPADGVFQDSAGGTGSAATDGRAPHATAVPPTAVPTPAPGSGAPALTDLAGNLDQLAARPPACDPRIPGSTTQPILLDGRPAVLVVHPAVGGYRLVEARDCTGKAILASTRLPA